MARRYAQPYRRLNPAMVAKTAALLGDRVRERFPDSGLAGKQTHALTRPYLGLRTLVFLLLAAGLSLQAWLVSQADWSAIRAGTDPLTLTPVIESAVNLMLLMFAGLWFLLTLEERLRRGRIQAWLHQLRAFAHVVDMHQLTKDPTTILNPGPRTQSSPQRSMTRFQLARYLEYCAEMLALTGKLSALMAGETDDHVIVAAASDVENLCTDLGRKVWQKIMILGELDER
jgi:hypothetical protein